MEARTITGPAGSRVARVLRRSRSALPEGNTLPPEVWERRHRALLLGLFACAPALAIYALVQGRSVGNGLLQAAIVLAFALAARLSRGQRLPAAMVSLGLMVTAAVFVALSGGMIEAHFSFFVFVVLLTLYEDWIPFLLAAAYVVVQHGVAGTVDPGSVYNHQDAIDQPWKWAVIHGFFVGCAGMAAVMAWRLNEDYRAESAAAHRHVRESERSLAEAQELAKVGSFEWNLVTGAVRWSEQLYRVFGRDPDSFHPDYDGYMASIHPDDRDRVAASVAAALERHGSFSHLYRCVRGDGSERTLHARGEVVIGEDGAPLKVVGTCQDVTEREQAEARAMQRAREQGAVAVLGEEALAGRDPNELFRVACQTVTEVLRLEIAAVMQCSQDGEDLVVKAVAGLPGESIGRTVRGGRRSQAGYTLMTGSPVVVFDWAAERRFEAADVLGEPVRSGATVVIRGRELPFGVLGVQATAHREFDEDDVNFLQSVANVLAAAIDRRRAENEIRHQALHDPLTGLPNRNLFGDRAAQALAHARRHGSKVAVLFADLDQFKLVNDSLGHEVGDELLRAVAPRLTDALRAIDTVARFGGDEFGMLIEEVDSERDATRVAERIAAALSRPFVVRGREHFVTATIGIAIGTGAESPEALIRDADAAMYRAKERGRGRYEIFDEVMRARVVEHLRIETDLRLALDRDELRVHYQPIVSLRDERIAGVEALVRWAHPERGLMAPGEFIGLAEESGLIVPVGAWVLETACRQVATWQARSPDAAPIWVSVNLSARQIADPNLPELVTRALADSGVQAACLKLEVTESALLEEGEPSVSTLTGLRELGIGLVLDDFGTGFSALGYLKRFPFDALKVDRSFVERLPTDDADAAIVEAVAGIAAAVGMSVVAEGLETPAQVDAARRLGCQYGQGFHYTGPLPATEMGELLGRGARWQSLAG